MSLLRIKQADGSWSNIPAIKGADGIDGKDGAVQYTAGRYIQIDEDTQTINCTVKIGDLVIIDAVPVKDSTNVVSSGGVYDALETKADKTDIAGLGSEAGFITSSVEDLKNYYKKSETYSQEEVNSLIGNLTRLTLQVVQELPEVGTEHIIYLVPNNESGNNIYEEWLFVQSKWEMIGTTEVDLSNYYTKEEIDNLLSQAPESDIVIYTGVSLSFGNQSEYSAKIGTIPADKRTEITNIVNSYHIGGGKFTKPIVFDFNGIRLKPLCSSQGNASGGKTTINFQLELTASSYTDPHKYDLATIELSFCFEGSQGSFTPNYSSSLSYWGVRAYFINYLSKSNTYAYTPSSNYHPATKKYVDDKVLDAIPQKSTMPTASATYLDKVYQYIGEDTEEFIKGYFYQCISETDAEGTVTYSWSKLTFGVDGGGDESPIPIFEWVNNNSRTYRNKIGYEDSRYNIGPDEASVQKLHEIFTKVQEDNIQNFGILMKMTGGKTGSVLLLCDTGGHPSTAGANYVSFHGIHNIDTVYFTLEIITLSITFMNGPAQPFTGLSCEEVAIKFTSDKRFTNYLNTYGLSKTNTTEFIPTGDYHPATKKYVDDAVANAGGGGSGGADLTGYATEEYVDEKVDKLLPTIPTYTFEINTSYRTGYQDTTYGPEKRFEFTADDMASMETLLKSIQSDGVRRFNLILVNDVDKSTHMLYSSNYLSSGVNTLTFRGVTASPDQKGALAIITLTINLSWSGDVLTVSGLTGWNTHMSAYSNLYGLNTMKGYFLEKSNTSAFTPTGDYNPATKKYVDDAIANIETGGGGTDLSAYYTKDEVDAKLELGCEDGSKIARYHLYGELYTGGTDSATVLTNSEFGQVILAAMQDAYDNRAEFPVACFILHSSHYNGYLAYTLKCYYNASNFYNKFIPRIKYSDQREVSFSLSSPTISNGVVSVSSTYIASVYPHKVLSSYDVLTLTNSTSYTPTGNYHPATKKYVDDAVANAGGDGPDLTPYAKLTDVLTKTNTTEYTPASAYHPATKQYVDQAVAGAGGITEESDPTVPLYVKNITQDMITKWNNASDETALTTKIESIVATMVGEDIAISYNTEDAWYNNKGVITNTTDIDDFILSTHEKIRNGEYPSIKIHLTRDDSYSTNKTTCVDLTYNGDYFYGTLYPTGSHSIMMTSYATEACMIKVDLAVNNTVIEIKPLVTLKSLVSNNNVAAYNGEHNFYTGLDDSDIMDTANTLYTDLNIAIDHQFLDFPRANGYTPPNGRELIIGLYKGRPAIRFDSYRIGASVGAFNTYDEIMSSSNYCTNVALGSDTTYNLCTIAETKLNKKYFTIWQMNRDGYIDAESGGTQLSWILGIPEWTGIGTSSGGGHGTRPLPEYLIPLIAKDTGDTLWATLYAFQDTGDTECLTFKLCLVNHLNDSRFAGKSYDLGGLCLTTPIVEIPGANATHSYVFKPVPNDDLTVRSFKVLEYYRWLETPEVE